MKPTRPTLYPWRDRSGRLSPLKAAVFAALFLPGLWTVAAFWLGALGPRPLNEAIHQLGLWAVRFLLISLAVTPLRQSLGWPRLVLVRRMVGVAAFGYAATHLLLYTADQAFDLAKVATEIALRIYLTIGFAALLGLSVLAATSTDAMVRRLGGRRWSRLHRLVYAIAALALTHYFMQAKLEVFEPTVMAGLFVWLMGYRMAAGLRPRGTVGAPGLALLSLAGAAITALGETAYFWLVLHAPPALALDAQLSLDAGIRPAWIVLAAGLTIALLAAARNGLKGAPRLRPA